MKSRNGVVACWQQVSRGKLRVAGVGKGVGILDIAPGRRELVMSG